LSIVINMNRRVEHATAVTAADPSILDRANPADRRPLTVVDVALHYGLGYDGLATYLRAKQRYAQHASGVRYHAIVPDAGGEYHGGHLARWHGLPGSGPHRRGEGRFTGRSQWLLELLGDLHAQVVIVHGPFKAARRAVEVARFSGARIVAVTHHREPPPVIPGERALRNLGGRRERRALAGVDLVTKPTAASAPDPAPVRLGVDPEFHPHPGLGRSREVVFAGEISHNIQVNALLLAANCPNTLWRVRIIGRGRGTRALRRAISTFGLSHRVAIEPFVADRMRLAQIFAGAGCVVNPGQPGRCQLALLEAAATGTPVVAPEGAPIVTIAPALAHTFPQQRSPALADAIHEALAAPPDPQLGACLAAENSWERAFDRELDDLHTILGI
jgi:glycosyltransferase involved in cell wall biosynthesis